VCWLAHDFVELFPCYWGFSNMLLTSTHYNMQLTIISLDEVNGCIMYFYGSLTAVKRLLSAVVSFLFAVFCFSFFMVQNVMERQGIYDAPAPRSSQADSDFNIPLDEEPADESHQSCCNDAHVENEQSCKTRCWSVSDKELCDENNPLCAVVTEDVDSNNCISLREAAKCDEEILKDRKSPEMMTDATHRDHQLLNGSLRSEALGPCRNSVRLDTDANSESVAEETSSPLGNTAAVNKTDVQEPVMIGVWESSSSHDDNEEVSEMVKIKNAVNNAVHNSDDNMSDDSLYVELTDDERTDMPVADDSTLHVQDVNKTACLCNTDSDCAGSDNVDHNDSVRLDNLECLQTVDGSGSEFKDAESDVLESNDAVNHSDSTRTDSSANELGESVPHSDTKIADHNWNSSNVSELISSDVDARELTVCEQGEVSLQCESGGDLAAITTPSSVLIVRLAVEQQNHADNLTDETAETRRMTSQASDGHASLRAVQSDSNSEPETAAEENCLSKATIQHEKNDRQTGAVCTASDEELESRIVVGELHKEDDSSMSTGSASVEASALVPDDDSRITVTELPENAPTSCQLNIVTTACADHAAVLTTSHLTVSCTADAATSDCVLSNNTISSCETVPVVTDVVHSSSTSFISCVDTVHAAVTRVTVSEGNATRESVVKRNVIDRVSVVNNPEAAISATKPSSSRAVLKGGCSTSKFCSADKAKMSVSVEPSRTCAASTDILVISSSVGSSRTQMSDRINVPMSASNHIAVNPVGSVSSFGPWQSSASSSLTRTNSSFVACGGNSDVQISKHTISKRKSAVAWDDAVPIKKEKPDDGYEQQTTPDPAPVCMLPANSIRSRLPTAGLNTTATKSRTNHGSFFIQSRPLSAVALAKNSALLNEGVTRAAVWWPDTVKSVSTSAYNLSRSRLAAPVLTSFPAPSSSAVALPQRTAVRYRPQQPKPSAAVAAGAKHGHVPVVMSHSSIHHQSVHTSEPASFSVTLALTSKVKSFAGRSFAAKYVAPYSAPSELYLPPPHRFVCPGCNNEYITLVGMQSHLARRSMVLKFHCTCTVQKWPQIFFNPCALASFYRSHKRMPGTHVAIDTFTAAVLRDETPEYRQCCDDRKRRQEEMAAANESQSQEKASKRPRKATSKPKRIDVQSCGDKEGEPEVQSCADGESCADGNCRDGETAAATIAERDIPEQTVIQEAVVIGEVRKNDSKTAYAKFFEALLTHRTTCLECGAMYKSRRALANHYVSRKSNSASSYVCNKCDMNLPSRCAYSAHVKLHNRCPPYVCPECGLHFDMAESFDVFLKHVERSCLHFMRAPAPFTTCVRCQAVISTGDAKDMARHMVDMHTVTYHKCQACPMAFATAVAAERHANSTGHNAQHRVLRKCPSCDAVFESSSNPDIYSHVHNHLTSSSLQCSFCSTRYTSHSQVVDHVRSSHAAELLLPETCEVCGRGFTSGLQLFEHIMSTHPAYHQLVTSKNSVKFSVDESEPSSKNKSTVANPTIPRQPVEPDIGSKFECGRCQMQFDSKELYKRHQAKHRFLENKKAAKLTVVKNGSNSQTSWENKQVC
jgi:hypothetical protein